MFVRIRNLREDNDLTQREIAEYFFCDQSLYSKYERGLRDVPVEIIVNVKYNLTFTIINDLKCLAHPQTKVCSVRIGK